VADFSAAPSALGYLFQCEIALLEALRRDDPALDISLETLDDITLEGNQLELGQVKLHTTPGNLADVSDDLWKTLRVWSTGYRARPRALLTLLTTAHAADGSIASLLDASSQRDAGAAHDRLLAVARSSANVGLRPAFDAFTALGDSDRRAMVANIVIVGDTPGFDDLDAAFKGVLRYAAPANRLDGLIARLREWWLRRAEAMLMEVVRSGRASTSMQEVEERLADIRDQLGPDSLPDDFGPMPLPTEGEVAEDQRPFVMQLHLVSLASQRIRRAVHDHNRAFEQRSRWIREDLVEVGELGRYEQRLVEEWERVFLPETDEEDTEELEEALRERGRSVFMGLEGAVISPIRPGATAAYVQRGSLHMLADDLRIGWHRDWVTHMQELLTQP